MTKRLEAIYENGALRLLQPVDLQEHQRVTVTLSVPEEDWLDTEFMESCAAEVQEHVPLERIHQILSTISGSLAEDIIAERDDR
jgi:predicted DNA-binding antitoxin AbrB/MazE fold protein